MKKKCLICGVELVEGNPNNKYGTFEGRNYISRHHLFPQRFQKYFQENEVLNIFGITKFNERAEFCYDCHEEMIHNLILNKEILEKLNEKMNGKNLKERIQIFHEIFKKGLGI